MRIFLVLAACSVLAPITAAAQNREQRAEARHLLESGQSQYEAHEYAEAAETFMQAYDRLHAMGNDRAPLALWNAGHSLSFVHGREHDAIETLQRFLDESTDLTDDEGVRDDRAEAQNVIRELNRRTEPREHASQPPHESRPHHEPHPNGAPGISPVGPIVLGIGVAGVIAGAITGGISLTNADALRAQCPMFCYDDPPLQAQYNDLMALSISTDVLLFGGAAIAVTGLVLTLVLREPAPASVACGPAGCMVEATF